MTGPGEEKGPLCAPLPLFYLNWWKAFSQSRKGHQASSGQAAQGVTAAVRNGVPILFYFLVAPLAIIMWAPLAGAGGWGEKVRRGCLAACDLGRETPLRQREAAGSPN